MKNKKMYLVEIKKNFIYGSVDGYKIFKEKEFVQWIKEFNLLKDSEIIINNLSYNIMFEDFKITFIDKDSYKVFKKYDKLSYNSNIFNIDNYKMSMLLSGEKWEIKQAGISNNNYINTINNVLSEYNPTWEIPLQYKDNIKFIGKRYCVLTTSDDINIHDILFLNAKVKKYKHGDMFEYHITLNSKQKAFNVNYETR